MTLSASATAFDAIASRYDTMFSAAANPLIAMMRERVFRAVDRHFPAPATVLEIGCGTGEDGLSLAQRGHRVVACDPAPAMIAAARAKVTEAGRADAFDFILGTVEAIADGWPARGAGGGRRVLELRAPQLRADAGAAAAAAGTLAPPRGPLHRGRASALCPLEVALFMARAQPRAALRRFRREAVADVEGQRFAMKYYGARDFDRALGAGFRRIETRSLGVFLPPLSFGPAFARVPGLLPTLGALEDRVSGWPGLRRMGDHVLLVYERD